MKPFTHPIRPEDVGELIDLTVVGDPDTRSMADMQLEGIAAIYNILCKHRFAYLADEVGMGKTYQALGLAALVWNEKPDARILFISPRQNLQVKWLDDYKRFFASNYRRNQRLGDDRATSVLFGWPVHRPVLFHNLRSWTPTIGMPERIAPFVRHTSFMRPIYLTYKDLGDMNDLWERTSQQLRSWGLYEAKRPDGLSHSNAHWQLNLAFADALNKRLTKESGEQAYFDLVIVDEAQCLRNPTNQTNRVLFAALRRQVKKWLFMSATPAHGGPGDLPRILNHYPQSGEILDPNLVHCLPAMQESLRAFLVRRPRRYRTRKAPIEFGKDRYCYVGKDQYRNHDSQGWRVRDDQMSVLGTLAMGLVQKGLVKVLQGRSNRYRIGFLSSFESLQSSIRGTLPPLTSDSDLQEEQGSGDWHRDRADAVTESEAPDTEFIQRLASSFEERFGMPLPHPKVDSVVDRVAPLAFGTNTEEGGHKFLIFTRRVSTVHTLCDRLILRHRRTIEDRVRRYWGRPLNWSGKSVQVGESDDTEDPTGFDADPGESPFRKAMSKKGWLFRYRQTFHASGRNALFFEDGWLRRLCHAGGVDPATAAAKLPDELWAESWTHASRSAGAQRYRANRLRYLAVQAIRRFPNVFGLDAGSAAPWRTAYEAALHKHLHRATPDKDPHHAPELFTQPTLWTAWDDRSSSDLLPPLPVAQPSAAGASVTDDKLCCDLYRRQVVRTLLGQTFQLTDTVLDLFYADEQSEQNADAFPERFLDWLESDDPSARQIRRDCNQWMDHLRLIVDSCLDGAGRDWRELARQESWPQLYNPMPVISVIGGSGAHRVATRQFRTPSLPRVIVCTDTLKEGVDLHLFCDRVLHYGVAWTSGDLEQRVGRVDRFFSQIERRLQEVGPPDVELHVGYPHVVASLERGQVERVIERQKRAELLMDSPLASALHESKDMVVGASRPRETECELGPYTCPPNQFPDSGRPVVTVSEQDARKSAGHYGHWYTQFKKVVEDCGWRISPGDQLPVRVATIYGTAEQHDLEWRFDATLGRYVLTLADLPRKNDAVFNDGMRRRLVGRRRKVESFLRFLVPTPEEGVDGSSISRLVAALDGQFPRADVNAAEHWRGPLASLANGRVEWVSAHEARATIPRGDREQRITVYAHKGGVRVLSVVAPLNELEHRREWGGAPTAEHVRDWALDRTNDLALGYLDVHDRDRLVFGIHVLHGELSENARRRLVNEVAWRADAWEAAFTGADRR